MKQLRILIACERSGTMREAFRAHGHEVYSVDLQESVDASPFHIVGSVFEVAADSWDVLFGFPPCTYLAKARMWECNTNEARANKRDHAVGFFRQMLELDIPHIALENPVGYLNTHFQPPSQIIHPWHFGDPYRKEICLWLKNLPPIIATCYNPVRKHVHNHTNSRMTQFERANIKSSWKYYPGMSLAIADQWSSWLKSNHIKTERHQSRKIQGSKKVAS